MDFAEQVGRTAIVPAGPESEIASIFFVCNGVMDWMACVCRITPNEPWELRSRLKFYGGDDPWDGGDTRTQMTVIKGDRDSLLRSARLGRDVAKMGMRKNNSIKVDTELKVDGDSEKAMTLLMDQPWAHVKVVPKTGDPRAKH